jgi:hypothetical protein
MAQDGYFFWKGRKSEEFHSFSTMGVDWNQLEYLRNERFKNGP